MKNWKLRWMVLHKDGLSWFSFVASSKDDSHTSKSNLCPRKSRKAWCKLLVIVCDFWSGSKFRFLAFRFVLIVGFRSGEMACECSRKKWLRSWNPCRSHVFSLLRIARGWKCIPWSLPRPVFGGCRLSGAWAQILCTSQVSPWRHPNIVMKRKSRFSRRFLKMFVPFTPAYRDGKLDPAGATGSASHGISRRRPQVLRA